MSKWLENEMKIVLITSLTFHLTTVKWSVTDLGGLALESIFKHCHCVLERLLLLEPSSNSFEEHRLCLARGKGKGRET